MTCTHRPTLLFAAVGIGITLLTACAMPPDDVEATETPQPTQYGAQDRAFLVNLDDTFTHVNPASLIGTAKLVCDDLRDGNTMEQVLVTVTDFVKFVEPGLNPADTTSRTVDFVHAATNAYCPER
jgi:hypothetical protein